MFYRQLPRCGHCFHLECIDRWLQRHAQCPLCRSYVGTEYHNSLGTNEDGDPDNNEDTLELSSRVRIHNGRILAYCRLCDEVHNLHILHSGFCPLYLNNVFGDLSSSDDSDDDNNEASPELSTRVPIHNERILAHLNNVRRDLNLSSDSDLSSDDEGIGELSTQVDDPTSGSENNGDSPSMNTSTDDPGKFG